MKIKFFAFAIILICTACSNSGGGSSPGSSPSPNHIGDSQCAVEMSADADHLAIAKAFNEYRIRCNPSEADLDTAIRQLQ